MKLDANGNIKITIVDGTTLTGLWASDGSLNMYDATDATTPVGLHHACGAINACVVDGTSLTGVYAPTGAINVYDGLDRKGLYHPCGAWNVDTAFATDEQLIIESLFSNSEDGAFYAPWDLGTMISSRTAGSFVTSDTDPVGVIVSKQAMYEYPTALEWYAAQTTDVSRDSAATGNTGGSGAVATYNATTHVIDCTTSGSSASYPRFTWGTIVNGSYYYIKARFSGDTGNLVDIGGSATANRISIVGGEVEGIFLSNSTALTLTTDGQTTYTVTIDELQVVEIPGFHAVAPSDAARPQLRISNGKYWLQPDGVDDYMTTTLDLITNGTANAWEHVGGWRFLSDAKAAFGLSNQEQAAVYSSGNLSWYDTSSTLAAIYSGVDELVDHVVGVSQTDASNITGYYNGTAEDTQNPYDGSTPTYGLSIFSRENDAAALPFDGRFYGGVWVDRVLTTDERTQANDFFDTKIGLITEAQIVTQLFGSSEDGALYNPYDTTSMIQSRTASGIADYANADGDVIGVMFDKHAITPGLTIPEWANQQTSLFTLGTQGLSVSLSGGSNGSYNTATGEMSVSVTGSLSTYPRYTASNILTTGNWYYLKIVFSGDIAQMTDIGSSASANRIQTYVDNGGLRTYEGYFQALDAHLVITTDGTSAYDITINSIQIVEVPGNHLVAPSDAARPTLQIDGWRHYVEFDGVDDCFDTATLTDLSADTIIATGINTTDTLWIRFNALSNGLYELVSADSSAVTPYSGSFAANPPTYRLDGVDIEFATRDDVYQSLLSGPNIVLSENVNYTGYTGFRLFAYYTGGLNMAGNVYGMCILDRALTTSERVMLELYLAERSGVDL